MVVLPNTCSVKFQPNILTWKHHHHHHHHHHQSHCVAIMTKTSTKTLDRFINNDNVYHPVLQQQLHSSRLGQLSARRTLITKDLGELKTKQNDETFEKQVETVICRLREVVEKVRDLEIEKLNGKLKGTMSDEDRLLVEIMSREIVDKLLNRPVQYLKTGCGDFETRLKDLNLLVRMLEKSCSGCQ